MWWDIIKSTREEAYSHFVEQFGPGTNPEDWEVFETLIMGDGWLIGLDSSGDISLGSDDEYKPHTDFVLGMFREEYPERYNEIGDLLKQLMFEGGEWDGDVGVPQLIGSINKREFVKNHNFEYGGYALSSRQRMALYKAIMVLVEEEEIYEFELPRVDITDFDFISGNIDSLFYRFERIAERENIPQMVYHLGNITRLYDILHSIKYYEQWGDSRTQRNIKNALDGHSIHDYKIVRV